MGNSRNLANLLGTGSVITSGKLDTNIDIAGTLDATGVITADAGIALPSGQGIDFSATANSSGTMSSELFDDYEEGSFTPRLYGATTDPTAGKIDATSAVYAKIGQAVYFYAFWSNVDTSGASGTMTIDQLPFTQITGITQNYFPYVSYTFDLSDKDWFFLFGAATSMTAYHMTAGAGASWLTRNITASAGKYLNVAGVYLAS